MPILHNKFEFSIQSERAKIVFFLSFAWWMIVVGAFHCIDPDGWIPTYTNNIMKDFWLMVFYESRSLFIVFLFFCVFNIHTWFGVEILFFPLVITKLINFSLGFSLENFISRASYKNENMLFILNYCRFVHRNISFRRFYVFGHWILLCAILCYNCTKQTVKR